MGTSGVAAKAFRMRSLRLLVSGTVLTVAAGLAACSGNMGTGSMGGSLPVPAANGYQQPQGPSAASSSRQRIVEGAVYVTSDLAAIPLPDVDGFSLALSLATPAPVASASPGPSATPTARSLRQKVSRVVVVAQAAVPSESAVTPIPAGSALPSAGPSASPSAAPSPSPAAKPSASSKATAHPSPSPTASGPKIETKLVAYPDYAPDAPTPVPSGNVQTFAKRKPLVRGYVSPAVDLPLYGLAAARFTIPTAEQLPNRGYTVAIFTSVKKHKQQLVASDSSATLVGSVVASTLATPLTLKKGTGYDIVLYGDEGPSTPAPIASGYATPGTNPFVTPVPTGYPGQTGYPQNGFTTPYPGQTYAPPGYQTPTPYPTR